MHIEVGFRTYLFYFRDMLQSVLDTLRDANDVQLDCARLELTVDGDERRSHTLNSDLLSREQDEMRRMPGEDGNVAGVMLHMDEAVIAWNGATYVYPIRTF